MRYVIRGNQQTDKGLADLAISTFAAICRDPVRTAALMRNQTLLVGRDKGFDIFARVDQRQAVPLVYVDRAPEVVVLILPPKRFWADENHVEPASKWVQRGIDACKDNLSLEQLGGLRRGRVRLKHAATLLGKTTEQLVQELTHKGCDLKQQMLADCLEKTPAEPDWWIVDLNGYAFAQLAEEIFRDAALIPEIVEWPFF